MDASERPVFLYHADANAIGGQITAPVQHVLPSHGSASLAQAGGHAAGSVGPHKIDGIISFQHAHSQVYGTKRSATGPWTSTITSVVEKFDLLHSVRADSVVCQMKISHPHVGLPPHVSFAGTHFENLTVDGHHIHVEFDFPAFERTEAQVAEHGGHWHEDERHVGAAVRHTETLTKDAPAWVERRYGWMKDEAKRTKRGNVVCSLVKKIRVTDRYGKELEKNPYRTFGHILHVPEVGNLFLGEIYVSHGMFRLTMLRAEMGCRADGEVSVASGGGNGGTMPG